MGSRELLGAANVDDAMLNKIVAAALDEPEASVRTVDVQRVDYALPALTTAARWWVAGTASTKDGERPYRVFVKHIQSFARSPFFAMIPAHARADALASIPWRTEGLLYRTDVDRHLPTGLAMPRALAVVDIDDGSMGLWLPALAPATDRWTTQTYRRAAYLIGRLAVSEQVREYAAVGERDGRMSPRRYADGRIGFAVAPALRDSSFWKGLAAALPDCLTVRDDLLAALECLPGYLDELDRAPLGTAHGDACANNLLRTDGSDDLVMIDFGFWSTQPVGFDLAQLVLGNVHTGVLVPGELADVDLACRTEFIRGVHDEGSEIPARMIERVHALTALIYSGISALVLEPGLPSDARDERLRIGVRIAQHTLDRVRNTHPIN